MRRRRSAGRRGARSRAISEGRPGSATSTNRRFPEDGGFIPGIRVGRPTAEYVSYVLNRITWPGSLYLGLIALVPTMALVGFGASQNFPFGGTSILIIVGVGLETVKQIESQLHQRNYEGFLR
jgi:preprotein translocase subunit SecY